MPFVCHCRPLLPLRFSTRAIRFPQILLSNRQPSGAINTPGVLVANANPPAARPHSLSGPSLSGPRSFSLARARSLARPAARSLPCRAAAHCPPLPWQMTPFSASPEEGGSEQVARGAGPALCAGAGRGGDTAGAPPTGRPVPLREGHTAKSQPPWRHWRSAQQYAHAASGPRVQDTPENRPEAIQLFMWGCRAGFWAR